METGAASWQVNDSQEGGDEGRGGTMTDSGTGRAMYSTRRWLDSCRSRY